MSKAKSKHAEPLIGSDIRYVLLGIDRSAGKHFDTSHALWCDDDVSVRVAVEHASGNWTWICAQPKNVERLLTEVSEFQLQHKGRRSRIGDLLMLESARPQVFTSLHGFFFNVIGETTSFITLPLDQLVEALTSDQKDNLFIGGVVDQRTRTVALVRGSFQHITVPFSFFKPSGTTKPDFRRFMLDDYGHTIQFGGYEASADAILYELDSTYRRRLKARRQASEQSLGASIRRLRMQRGLRRTDFPDISAKTIARIERSEIRKPHNATLSIIARTLGVDPGDIDSY